MSLGNPIGNIIIPRPESLLVCCHKDGELVYRDTDIATYNDTSCLAGTADQGGIVAGSDATATVAIYPNPCSDWLKVEGDNINEADLCDTKGVVVMESIAVNERTDMSNIPSGVYLLCITTLQGTSIKKLVVQH